jgi:hypothetical protein
MTNGQMEGWKDLQLEKIITYSYSVGAVILHGVPTWTSNFTIVHPVFYEINCWIKRCEFKHF